jgi:hypothetical protein
MKTTDNPRKHTEKSSIDTDEGSEEKLVDAKPPVDNTVVVLHSPLDHHENPPTIAIATIREARDELQP